MANRPGHNTLDTLDTRLKTELNEAERKAWDNLARYKFANFGYWSSVWVRLNRLGQFKRPNPFQSVVKVAGRVRDNQQEIEK